MEALSQRNLRGFFPTLVTVAERLRKRWLASEVVDLCDDLMRFTVDVTTSLVFGKDLNTLEGGEDVIQRDLALVFPTFARRLNALVPYWRVLRLPKDRQVDRAIAELRVWLAELITETRARLAAEPGRPPQNFLEAMLASRDDDGRPFSDEVLFGNAMTMLLAGEDTTANSVAWAIHLLCDHPEEVAALRAEIDDVLGDDLVPRDLERANRLERATAVSQESMRLLPVAPLNFVEALHDTVVGDIDVPKGTGVVVLGRIAATDARHFADPDRFRPARWLEDATGAHDPSALLPFGSGPRICPGRTLALVEMRVMLATLYRSFEVERVSATADVRERYAFTVMPSELKVRLRRR
jgi:cytochrome P450